MKIDFEVDEERIQNEAISRIVQMIYPAIEAEVKGSVRALVVAALGERTRALTKQILETETMPGSAQTLTEFIHAVLNRKESTYRERSHLHRVIEETAYQEAMRIFQESLRGHADEFRKKLVEHIIAATTKG